MSSLCTSPLRGVSSDSIRPIPTWATPRSPTPTGLISLLVRVALGYDSRVQVREGFVADLVVFDPETVSATNSFDEPKSYPVGVPYVIVNGVVVIDNGEHAGTRPGKPLRGPAYSD